MKELIFLVAFYTYLFGSWIVNLIQFLQCDFQGPWKDEIVKGIGVLLFPANCVTVWM